MVSSRAQSSILQSSQFPKSPIDLFDLFARCPHEIVQQLPLMRHFLSSLSFELSEILLDLQQVGAPLRIEIADDVGQAERQLALLPRFALINHRPHAAENHVAIGT